MVGSYHIGKERAYLGAAHQLGWRVHCAPAKRRLLRLLGLPQEWLALLTDSAEEAQVGTAGPLGCAMPCRATPCRAAHHSFCIFGAALRRREGEVPRGCFPRGKSSAGWHRLHRCARAQVSPPCAHLPLRRPGLTSPASSWLTFRWTAWLQIHVLGMGEQLHEQALADRIAGTRWSRVVAIKPTGEQTRQRQVARAPGKWAAPSAWGYRTW